MGKYDDYIYMDRPVSDRHPHMSVIDRAAQFSPFAALTGLDDEMEETARIVDSKIELTEDEVENINIKLQKIAEELNDKRDGVEISMTYFIKDALKEGGIYTTRRVMIKKIKTDRKELLLAEGSVNFDDIIDIEI